MCDQEDITAIRKVLKNPKPIPWEEAKKELRMTCDQLEEMATTLMEGQDDIAAMQHRMPIWVQDEEIPECCGCPMFFVDQIDDEMICTEPPPGAKLWWHDVAVFYVFTCPMCLRVKAVGQQA